MSSTIPTRTHSVRFCKISAFLVWVCLFAETPAFATDMARTALAREGVTIVGGDGSSFENAIVVHAADLQRAFIGAYEYILLGYRLLQFSTVSIVRYKGKHYHVITFDDVTTIGPFPHQKKRVFYFDMSDYYGKKSSSTAIPSAKAVPKIP